MMRNKFTRRDLIKHFGLLAFALSPVARAMGQLSGGASFKSAPRFVMFFKGGSFHPASTRPASLAGRHVPEGESLVRMAGDEQLAVAREGKPSGRVRRFVKRSDLRAGSRVVQGKGSIVIA